MKDKKDKDKKDKDKDKNGQKDQKRKTDTDGSSKGEQPGEMSGKRKKDDDLKPDVVESKKMKWTIEQWMDHLKKDMLVPQDLVPSPLLHSYLDPVIAAHVAIMERTLVDCKETQAMAVNLNVEHCKILSAQCVPAFKVQACCANACLGLIRIGGGQARPLTVPEALVISGFEKKMVNLSLLTAAAQREAIAKVTSPSIGNFLYKLACLLGKRCM